jgi:hypothetical protein
MAGLNMRVKAKMEELLRLQKGIDELKSKLKDMNRASDPKSFDKMNKTLYNSIQRHDALQTEVINLTSKMDKANKQANATASGFGNLNSMLLKIGGTAALISLGKQIIDVRSEFQQLEIAFGTMLKSGEKAQKLIGELADFAAKTPFGLSSASAAAKQLLAYGSAADNVIKELTMLGDVAAGTGQQIGDIVYLYGTLRMQGRAYLMDIRQFAGRGIPIYKELANVLKINESQVNDFVSAGKVGFKEVEQAFKNMTARGGLYGGLMENQSKALRGQIEALKDNVQMAFNDIGKSSEGVVGGVIKGVSSLVENYEKVGKIILELVAVYGIYRTALVLTTIATQSFATTQFELGLILGKLQKSMAVLTATMTKNPYVAVTAAVVALGYGLYKVSTRTTEWEKAQKRLNETQDDFKENIASETANIQVLFGRLKAAKEGTDGYQKAKDAIISKYGQYLTGLGKEIETLQDVAGAYEAISKAARQAAADRAITEATKEASDVWAKSWQENASKVEKSFQEKFGKEEGTRLSELLLRSLGDGEQLSEELKKAVASWDVKFFDEIGGSTTENYMQTLIGNIRKSKGVFDKEILEINRIFGGIFKPKGGESGKENLTTITQEVKDVTGKISTLKKEIKDLRSGKMQADVGKTIQQAIEERTKSLKEFEDALATLTGVRQKEVDKANKQAQKIADAEVELLNIQNKDAIDLQTAKLNNEQKLLNIQQEGFDKRQAQLKLNYEKEKIEIIKLTQELIEEQQKAERTKWEQAGSKGVFTPKTKSAADLSPENKKRVEDRMNTAGIINKEENKQLIDDLLDQYQDFTAKKFKIDEKYTKDALALQSLPDGAGKDAAIAQLYKDWKEALSAVSLEEFQDQIDWETIFSDLDKVSTDSLIYLRDKLKKYLSEIGDGISKEDLKEVSDAFKEIDKAITNRKPFDTLSDSLKEYRYYSKVVEAQKQILEQKKKEKATTEEIRKAEDNLAKSQGNRAESLKKVNDAINNVGAKGSEIVNLGNDMVRMLENFGVNVSDGVKETLSGVGEMMAGLESIDITKPFSVVTGIIKTMIGLGNTVAGIFGFGKNNKAEKDTKRLEAITSKIESLNEAINKQLEKRIELIEESTAAEAKYLNTLSQQQIEQQKNYILQQLNLLKNTEIFGLKGKNNDLDLVELMKMMGLTSMEQFIDWWNDGGYQQLLAKGYTITNKENWQSIIDAWNDLTDASEKSAEAAQEAITGISFDSLKDSLDDLVTDAETTFGDIADSFEDQMSQAVLNFVKKAYLDDKLKAWYDQFQNYMSNQGKYENPLTTQEADALRKAYEEAYQGAQDMYDQAMAAAGIDTSSSSSQEASSKGYQTLSEDTGLAIEGRFAALQMSGVRIEQFLAESSVKTDRIIAIIDSINEQMEWLEEMRNIQMKSMEHLSDINKWTKVLPEMNDRLGKIESNTRDL